MRFLSPFPRRKQQLL
ncbi:hypothetical protein ZEAMMB73_Zm00001d003835 [Zea mays]|uniref:Uncharacterized protein n=1 Tax=Zea mays TaxID=4577 RepID=A0A1D6EBU4_MAIZE|nr:hypothetical protein ZEAMMB73_Zm00001d003835 [Zea mays]